MIYNYNILIISHFKTVKFQKNEWTIQYEDNISSRWI